VAVFKTWQFNVTPIGAVFGRTNGVAPGCEASVSWKVLVLSIDNEYVLDTNLEIGELLLLLAAVDDFPRWLVQVRGSGTTHQGVRDKA
jgi:hypothetical protein